jgi:molybdate transport system substrate-binding protein
MRAIGGMLLVVFMLLEGLQPAVASGQDLTVAAATALNFAMKDLIVEFEKTTGIHVKPSFGASGSLLSQIQAGEPYDLFFSANLAFPKKLEEIGAAVPGSLYTYAVGRLVVWVPVSSALVVETLGLEALLDPSVRKIAVANPKHAPYGMAAVAALQNYKIYDRVKDKLIFAANVIDAARMADSGAADAGLIALSLALAPSMKAGGKYWEVPPDAHPSLEQGAVILKSSKNQEAARAFLSFVQSEQGQVIMQRYGFLPPQAEVAKRQ